MPLTTLIGSLSTNDSYESQMANYGQQIPTYTQARTIIANLAAFLSKQIVGEGALVCGGVDSGLTYNENEVYIGIIYFTPSGTPFTLSPNLANGSTPINNQTDTQPFPLGTGIVPFTYFRQVVVSGNVGFAFFYGYKFTLQNV